MELIIMVIMATTSFFGNIIAMSPDYTAADFFWSTGPNMMSGIPMRASR